MLAGKAKTVTTDYGIGASVPRKEDDRFLLGRGNYVSDMVLPGQREVAFLRSPLAHARILGIRKPATSPGQAVFTWDDLDGVEPIVATSTIPGFKVVPQHALAHEKVRHVGEMIAMAVAATRADAEDLIERVEVDYEEIEPVVDALAALKNRQRPVHDEIGDHLFVDLSYDSGFQEKSRGAPVVVKREISLSRQTMSPLEGKAIVAYWDDRTGQLVVYSSCQAPHIIRIGVAKFLNLDQNQVRVVSPDVGGGFGYKLDLKPEELCLAWLARKFRKPFRYIEDRREHLITGANTRQHHYHITGYADARGRLQAIDAEVTVDGGAYSNWHQTIALEPSQVLGNLPGPYDFRGYRVKSRCVATNKPGFLPYRGVARTGVCFAMELMIDAIAREVGREPWEVRMENLVPASALPYNNVTGKHFDSGDYPKSLELAREKIDFDKWRERQKRGEPDGRLIGIGVTSYVEQSAHGISVFTSWGMPIIPGYDHATARLTPDGGLELRAGVHSHGQGMETSFAQIGHQVLGIDFDNIRVILGDTNNTPFSTGTYASRSIVMAGGAIARACEALIPRILKIGAHLMQCASNTVRYEKGHIIGPQTSIPLSEVTAALYYRPDRLPPDVDLSGLEQTMTYKPKVDTGAFCYASHAAVVAVDPRLGHIEVLDYVIVEDCGTRVNPMLVDGQTWGGAAQGVGTAMYEESSYDVNGQPLATTLADYILPGPTEVPKFRSFHMVTPSPYTEFGIKGMGEGGAIAPPATICNAVNDALRPLGAEICDTPLSPRRVLAAIERAKAGRSGRAGT
ncbi:MAG: xanthine dehydrogenase family protein [Hyphomicrobiales bacterium]|nr:xanthine dehydrogenase family protein [Hyphomicrobiales bacterium]